MTLDGIKQRVSDIREASGDSEIAHGMEDRLFRDFVCSVSIYCKDERMRLMANEVLQSMQIKFSRWTA